MRGGRRSYDGSDPCPGLFYCFVKVKFPVFPEVGYAVPLPSRSVWLMAADPVIVVPLRVPVNAILKFPLELASDTLRLASLPVMFPVPLVSNGSAVQVVYGGL